MDRKTTTHLTGNRTPLLAVLGLAAVGALVLNSGSRGPLGHSKALEQAALAAPVAPAALAAPGAVAPPVAVVRAPVAVASHALASVGVGTQTLTPDMRREFEALIKDYLLKNPEVMVEVQTALETKMEKAQAEKTAVVLKENAAELFQLTSAPSVGNPKGDVTIVEFFDYNCGYCKKALPDVTALVQSDKNVRFVMKEYPILSKGSEEASKVALAAKKQGKYWDFHLAMLGLQGQANEASALKIAEKVGLDMTKLKTDMVSADVKKELEDTRALATKMGINGTPHFLVGDKAIAGAPENLTEVLATNISDLRKAGGCKVCGG